MTDADRLRAAASAAAMPSGETQRALLDSIVTVARAIFAAKASSIMLFDEPAGELVFEAVAGEGADRLVGTRFSATQGIAGFVLSSGQSLVIEDVGSDPRFARYVAERSGYIPRGLMAVPLHGRRGPLGVLQVLDRPQKARFSLRETELLGLFAEQAAIALDLVQDMRQAQAALSAEHGDVAVLARVASALNALDGERGRAARQLLEALEVLLTLPR